MDIAFSLLVVAAGLGILSGLGSSLFFNYMLTRDKHLLPGDVIYYVRGTDVLTTYVDVVLLEESGIRYHVQCDEMDMGFVVADDEFGETAFTDIDDAVLVVTDKTKETTAEPFINIDESTSYLI